MRYVKAEKINLNCNITKTQEGDTKNVSPFEYIKIIKNMELFTKEIIEKAKAQYPLGSDMESQMVVAKFFNPCGAGTWYLMNMDPEDEDYCWGFCQLFESEIGSFSRFELENTKVGFGLGIERDLYFEPVNANELWEKLIKGIHV